MIRFERRVDRPRWLSWAVPVGSIIGALAVGAAVVGMSGQNPLDTYLKILDRGFLDHGALSATLVAAGPLLFTGLAAAVAFRMGLFNIGGEGQLLMGAVGATAAGLALGDWPIGATIVAMVVAGALAGAFWAAISGALRAWAGTNEIITSLMLNYLAYNLANYLIFGSTSYWRKLDGTGRMFPQGRPLGPDSYWPKISLGPIDVPLGFAIGLLVAFALWVLVRRTRFGFAMRVIGDEPRAARFAGMRTKATVFALMALSGGVAGIGGAADVGDTRHLLDPKALGQAGYGYAGIVVAALARLNPLAVVITSILMGGLANAGRALQGPDFSAGLVGTLQGLLLLCVLAGEAFARFRVVRTPRVAADPEPPGTVALAGEAAS